MFSMSSYNRSSRSVNFLNRFSLENKPRVSTRLLHKDDSRSLPQINESVQPDVVQTTHYDVLVVGCGLSGVVMADQFASILNKKVLIIDKRDHIGGNCYDYRDEETNILMNKYGAHLFHTNSERVWEYVNRFCKWVKWEHEVYSLVDDKLVNVPVNINTVNQLLGQDIKTSEEMDVWLQEHQIKYETISNSEEMAKSRIGEELYDKMIKHYTYKQWGKYPNELDASVLARIPIRNNFDNRYFDDKYQALPENGYTYFINKIINNKNIDVKLNTSYFDLVQDKNKDKFETVIYTGPIDQYFSDKNLDKLEYRSIEFQVEKYLNLEKYQPNSVVNYPANNVPFTRIVEYKHFLNQPSDHTVIVKEVSTDVGEPYYPVPNVKNQAVYEKYKELAVNEETNNNVHFLGRLANYKYFNMDTAIQTALEYFDSHFINQHSELSKQLSQPPPHPKICFITAIYGNYEVTCKKFIKQTVETDFICFSDSPNINSNGWIVDATPYHVMYKSTLDDMDINYTNSLQNNKHTFNIAKYYKQAFRNIPRLSAYDVIIWIDGTIEITHPKTSEFIMSKIYEEKIIGWHHEHRNGILQHEVSASHFFRYTSTYWNGQSQPYQDIDNQYHNYIQDGYTDAFFKNNKRYKNDPCFGVWITCFVAFLHKDEKVKDFLDLWYLQTLKYTTQDQIGFPYVCQKTNLIPYTLPNAEVSEIRGEPHKYTSFYIKHDHGR
jgi:UDP-galactopyranose mutase